LANDLMPVDHAGDTRRPPQAGGSFLCCSNFGAAIAGFPFGFSNGFVCTAEQYDSFSPGAEDFRNERTMSHANATKSE